MAEIDPWRERQRTKSRETIFLQKDEAIFSEALRQEFPGVRFFEEIAERGERVRWPEVSGLSTGRANPISIVFPEYIGPVRIEEELAQDRAWFAGQRRPFHRSMNYRSGSWAWEADTSSYYRDRLSYDPPTPYEGMIWTAYFPDYPQHKMHLEIVKRVWKVMSRVATGKYKGGHPLGNELMGSDIVLMKDRSHRNPWMGHWALQWCRDGIAAEKQRMLRGLYRPCDDWEMPRTSEYQALCRAVEEKYGKNFGGAPSAPQG